jgi:hypothetical protein
MKITDIIRSVLDIIDHAEHQKPAEPTMSVEIEVPQENDVDTIARLKQVAGLLPTETQQFSNSPEEKVADINAVTASGTDLMKSKHPADIRTNAPSMYPNAQWRP